MSARFAALRRFVPPFPRRPRRGRAARCRRSYALRRNPLEIWSAARISSGRSSIGRSILGLRAAAHDPAAVRRIFLDNAANYRKDDLQLRVLRPGPRQRAADRGGRGLAHPAPRARAAVLAAPGRRFAPAMHRVAARGRRALSRRRDGAVTDVGATMSRMTLEVLEQTLFSQGLGRERERVSARGHELFRHLRPARSARSRWARRRSCRGSGACAAAPRCILRNGGRRHHRRARKTLIDRGGEAPRRSLDAAAVGARTRRTAAA